MLALVLLLGLGITLAYAEEEAQKIVLIDETDGSVAGWVIANKNDSGEIILEVHVQKAEEGTLFYVFIVDNNWVWTGDACRKAEFTTNRVGNGNLHVTIPSIGVTLIRKVVVREPYDVWQAGGGRYFTTELVCFSE